MRKKMKLFIAMVSVGALLGTMPVMASEQPELPTKVQDIANGSDELYGEGVPIEHGTNPDERFSSGGVDHTHQYIVANALKILSNDKGNSAFNGELNSSILMEATDWLHFAPVSGHWCVCQWPLGATSGRKLIDYFVFDHNVIMFCYPLKQRVG